MSQRRGTTTNQLSSVLQVLQMGRKTGILYVEREGEKGIEAGRMTFVQGHITEAQLGNLQGSGALIVLYAWEACRFLFISEQQPDRTTQTLRAVPVTKPEPSIRVKGPEQTPPQVAGNNALQGLQSAKDGLQRLESCGLSRVHRRLLLLLNGQRRLPELARLMNRREDEVWQLLRDLAEHDLLQKI